MFLRRACFVTIATLAACSDSPTTTVRLQPEIQFQVNHRGGLTSLDDRFAMIAASDSEFGGMFYDEQHRLAIVMTDPRKADIGHLRSSIARVFPDRADLLQAPIDLRTGRFDWAQLYHWAEALPKLPALVKGVVSADIDEVTNQLVVGVENDAAIPLVVLELQKLGVPREAATVKTIRGLRLLATLQDGVTPELAGFKISTASGASCTLGFNAHYWATDPAKEVFATNGHCSAVSGVVDSTKYYQPTYSTSNYIGYEIAEAPEFSSSTDSRCPITYSDCKYSDLSLNLYEGSFGYYGGIMSTTSRSSSGPPFTITTNTIVSFYTEQYSPLVGDVVDKIGERSGWTYGTVLSTPLYWGPSDAGKYYIIPYVAAMWSAHGDSGAAVFFNDASGFRITGQMFAGEECGDVNCPKTVFANMGGIHYGFAPMYIMAGY